MFQAIYGRPDLAWNGTLRPLLSQSRWGIGKVFRNPTSAKLLGSMVGGGRYLTQEHVSCVQ